MYISVGDIKIVVNLSPCPLVKIFGPDENYLIEINEFVDGDDNPKFVESYSVTSNQMKFPISQLEFKLPIEFYMDYDITIYKFVDGYGIKNIFNHRYNDTNKLVLFNLVTDDIEECEMWSNRVREYSKIHGCKPVVNSKFDKIDKQFMSFYNTTGIDYYTTYNIGRFPKTSTDFRTTDARKEGHNVIWFGSWKKFWSYQHPRYWKDLSSQEIVDDILGLK